MPGGVAGEVYGKLSLEIAAEGDLPLSSAAMLQKDDMRTSRAKVIDSQSKDFSNRCACGIQHEQDHPESVRAYRPRTAMALRECLE